MFVVCLVEWRASSASVVDVLWLLTDLELLIEFPENLLLKLNVLVRVDEYDFLLRRKSPFLNRFNTVLVSTYDIKMKIPCDALRIMKI